MLHEELDAVLFERDRVGVGLGDALDDLDVFDIELEAAGGAFVGADFAGDDDAGLLRQAFECLEDRGRHALDVGHALHGAGAIAKDGKQQLAAFARVVEPSVKSDGLAFKLAERGDGGVRGGGFRCFCCRWGGGDFFGHDGWALWAAWSPTLQAEALEGWGT